MSEIGIVYSKLGEPLKVFSQYVGISSILFWEPCLNELEKEVELIWLQPKNLLSCRPIYSTACIYLSGNLKVTMLKIAFTSHLSTSPPFTILHPAPTNTPTALSPLVSMMWTNSSQPSNQIRKPPPSSSHHNQQLCLSL